MFKTKVIYPHFNIVTAPDNIATTCVNCSFNVVATRMSQYLNKYYGIKLTVYTRIEKNSKVFVEDLFTTIITGYWSPIYSGTLYTLDTPFVATTYYLNPNHIPKYIHTTSLWNYVVAQYLGINADITPRGVDDDIASDVYQRITEMEKKIGVNNVKKYEVMALLTGVPGVKYKNHRLVHDVLKKLGIREKSLLICDEPYCDKKTWSLSTRDVYTLMAQSKLFITLSETEGFGIPPTEAMAVGTPVVHFDTVFVSAPFSSCNDPAVINDNPGIVDKEQCSLLTANIDDAVKKAWNAIAESRKRVSVISVEIPHIDVPYDSDVIHFPVPVIKHRLVEANHQPNKYYYSSVYNEDDVVNAVKEALMTVNSMSDDEVLEMQEQLHHYAERRFYHKAWLNRLLKFVVTEQWQAVR
ncbi:putative glycosyltransferase [Sulfolobales Beppu filamentous virus 3]|uniref:Putative glycosyltransferase n=1 Tax=Sulfolobales Beppu filamentous virus 3 TaxID=2493124 RepID=A0A3S8NF20_9VIRU|nr:glycosyltransferase [Sulfolobales Beppu filamentous virus 3]AZI75853.1 putative glycosyltransferase [Sulfolobales Beppu filamentous virus 3]